MGDSHRYERKFLLEDLTVHEIESLVQLHPALFSTLYPPRWVNNVYFDSAGLESFFDNVDGSAARTKVRIRWYGDARGTVDGARLELKHKQGLVGSKEVFSLAGIDLDGRLDRDAFADVFARSDLPDEVRSRVAGVVPTLINRYHRRYFRSADGRYRLTLDTELGFASAQRGRLDPRAWTRSPHAVLELKYPCEAEPDADAITGAFPFRLTKSSKYVAGLYVADPV